MEIWTILVVVHTAGTDNLRMLGREPRLRLGHVQCWKKLVVVILGLLSLGPLVHTVDVALQVVCAREALAAELKEENVQVRVDGRRSKSLTWQLKGFSPTCVHMCAPSSWRVMKSLGQLEHLWSQLEVPPLLVVDERGAVWHGAMHHVVSSFLTLRGDVL